MRRNLFRSMAVLGMTGGMVFAWAMPAWAHYPVVSGSAACSSGEYRVTWTVRNSESSLTMTVDKASVTLGTVSGLTGAYGGGASRTAQTTLPGTTAATVTLSVHGTWPDGVSTTRTAAVALAGTCTAPVTTTTTTSTTTTSTTTSSTTTTTTTAPPPTTTTTTASTTTTTAAPTTTTTTAAPTTTTTTAPTTTTTAGPTTTTTAPPTTTSTVATQVLGQTETKESTTTTTAAATVLGEAVAPPVPHGGLAHTGAAIGLLAVIGGGLLWVGLPLSRYKRREDDAEG